MQAALVLFVNLLVLELLTFCVIILYSLIVIQLLEFSMELILLALVFIAFLWMLAGFPTSFNEFKYHFLRMPIPAKIADFIRKKFGKK